MDGERALWKMLDGYEWDVVRVLDIYHVLEYLWDAAYCFCPESSDAAQQFVTERLRRILEGDVGRVIGGLKQMATKHHLRGHRKRKLFVTINYLLRNLHSMHYDEYLAKGYPIGSGVVEGACRHFVKDRMELTGMRWRTDPRAQERDDAISKARFEFHQLQEVAGSEVGHHVFAVDPDRLEAGPVRLQRGDGQYVASHALQNAPPAIAPCRRHEYARGRPWISSRRVGGDRDGWTQARAYAAA